MQTYRLHDTYLVSSYLYYNKKALIMAFKRQTCDGNQPHFFSFNQEPEIAPFEMKFCCIFFFREKSPLHTAGLDTIFIQIYMAAPQGVSKEQEGHKDQYLDVFLR